MRRISRRQFLGVTLKTGAATISPLWDDYPRWNFQTSDAPETHHILRKFEKLMAIHVHQVVYNSIGNISSAGLLSTSWPWPYPPVDLPYPNIKMNRVATEHSK